MRSRDAPRRPIHSRATLFGKDDCLWGRTSGRTNPPTNASRTQDEIVALQDLCIHRGTPLSPGWIEGEEIVCHYHGWRQDKGLVIGYVKRFRCLVQKCKSERFMFIRAGA